MSLTALEKLQTVLVMVFPYGVTLKTGTRMSSLKNGTRTETRMKSAVKSKARKTNNQASFSGSLFKNNMEVEAAMELARHLDETGLH
jgi:UDP-N-acetylenolpyruvoylglucosamine reductase